MPTDVNKDPRFETLLDYLKRTRGFDFTGYKRSSLMRRVQKRMQAMGINDFLDYMDFLEVRPDEFSHLFNTILINVTSFFRDETAWRYLSDEVLPQLLGKKNQRDPVRVWVAGCASGEEAYSIAIILAEALGASFAERAKIYATDIDEEALAQARQACYPASALSSLPEELKNKYFTQAGSDYCFRVDLRRTVIFGRHDLVQDPPISHLDLLLCRNTLMYLNAETQARIISRFHFALNDAGFLFLGKAEMLLSHANLFQQLDMKHRIFSKVPREQVRDRIIYLAQSGDPEAINHLGRHVRLRELSFDSSIVPQLVVDINGMVVLVNDRAKVFFGILASDIGKPLQDLEISYRPVELRSLIEQVYMERRPVRLSKVMRTLPDGRVQYLDLEIAPLVVNGDSLLGASITFADVTNVNKIQEELQRANQELETTNEELQSAHEELETTNEELQSTNEELETTNEELQSTNEELETMNEELQSTNEELETTNTELRTLTSELNSTNSFLSSILSSLRSAVIVVDKDMKIKVWNYRAEDMWGLRTSEVEGESLMALDIGLPVQKIKQQLQQALRSEERYREMSIDATNRRGKAIQCKIRCTRLTDHENGNSEGLVLAIDEA